MKASNFYLEVFEQHDLAPYLPKVMQWLGPCDHVVGNAGATCVSLSRQVVHLTLPIVGAL